MAYAAANALTVLDNAVASLRAERDAAAADAPAIAALLEQAAARVAAGRDRVRSQVASVAFTPERARDALIAAGVPARVDQGRVVVELGTGGRIVVEAWAQAVPADPRNGWSIAILGPSGQLATRARANDDPSLTNVVSRLYS